LTEKIEFSKQVELNELESKPRKIKHAWFGLCKK